MKQLIPFAVPMIFMAVFYALAMLDYKLVKRAYDSSRLARLLAKRGDSRIFSGEL